jgi:TonB family protein
MISAEPLNEITQSEFVPRLLVELPSRRRVFVGNLRDLVFPRRLRPLALSSDPGTFWPDVFVKPTMPWGRFIQSGAYHAIAFGLLIAATRFFALQPQVVAKPMFNHAEVIYYQPSEYLPPLDTREAQSAQLKAADPELSPQPIISLPPEADNRSQTVVTPPNVKLKHDVALPNIVAWSDQAEKPRLAIPDVPLTPAADIRRLAPQMEASVVKPPPDAAHSTHRNSPALQNSVVAPPPDVNASNSIAFQAPQSAVVAPPPSVEAASNRPLGDLNIGHSSVIAPAPQLSVAEQRTMTGSRGSRLGAGSAQVVAPPPSVSVSGTSGSAGAIGRVIALNLHPAVGAPPDPPAGNRRGAFAATPEGHAGASGSPGATASGKENGTGANKTEKGEVPSGLYVGSTAAKTSPVAGEPGKPSDSVNPKLMASVRPPRVTSAPSRPMQPDTAAKLSEPERAVFGNRKFYSVTLNMPNLNSAGGSWVIRFAELNHDSSNHDSSNHDASAAATDLSQPAATRKVDPAYPLQLMRENVAGTVILYAVIHADGSVGSVRVLRGVDDRLDRFASEAIAKWQFQPATKNGTAVDVEATFQIPFRPARVGTNF